ncbi:ABC transporter permease [Reichenbachiella sp. 5M10]|uniref:ABC transporter permease n=1 Tax=Reichenbachiella sp. 5M10 TaxID=1889772 RepID=UPI000C378DBC|nr:FtsX-like permease family protein [Reichenbachiella sp. 5M10]PIB36701.1 ABC transporter permease [Reichenbachiella sp. 5M10]
MSHTWLLRMAWKDSRRSRSKLLLFTLSITIGIAALVAINSFKENLNDEINNQSKSLLGADLEVYSQKPFTAEQMGLIDSMGQIRSLQSRFSSMIYFPQTGATRLIQVRTLKGDYPYYGVIETSPVSAATEFKSGLYALVDETLMIQYNANIGDPVKIGQLEFQIIGKLQSIPGQNSVNTAVAPVVYIPHQYLQQTGLVERGSRVYYSYFFKTDQEIIEEEFDETYKDRLEELSLRYETVDKRKKNTSIAFNNTTIFLNMSAFIALLLGSIGIAGAVYSYLQEKKRSVAILRCLGLGGKQAFLIYLYQVLVMGSVGSLIGVAIGTSLQLFMPGWVEGLVPFSIQTRFYWLTALEGLFIGIVVTLLFSLLPLLSILKVSPLNSIRSEFESENDQKGLLVKSSLYGLITLFLFSFSYFQIREWDQAAIFIGGLLVTFVLLWALSKGLIYLAKITSSPSWSFLFRHGVANLHRPKNQTGLLIITVGMCTMLISIMYFSRHVLLDQITLAGSKERPNMVLFDIQTHQKDEIEKVIMDFDLPVVQNVPVVTMRLLEYNGITKKEASQDSTLEIPDWLYNREYRVTFRDSLISSETLTEGQLRTHQPNDSIFISVDEGFAERRKWKLGDKIIFNVQGALMKTYIGSFRKIDWRRIQTNFLVLFPTGILEEAPQFHVLVTKVKDNQQSASFQQTIVKHFPNISIIDLELVLQTVEEVLTKISFVIQFMALISVLTGLLVLINSIVLSKSQRIKDSVLLRTLGAKSKHIMSVIAIEYIALGLIAATTGLLTAHLLTWVLSVTLFEAEYTIDFASTGYLLLVVTFSTLGMGLLNMRPVLNETPLTILRRES